MKTYIDNLFDEYTQYLSKLPVKGFAEPLRCDVVSKQRFKKITMYNRLFHHASYPFYLREKKTSHYIKSPLHKKGICNITVPYGSKEHLTLLAIYGPVAKIPGEELDFVKIKESPAIRRKVNFISTNKRGTRGKIVLIEKHMFNGDIVSVKEVEWTNPVLDK